MKPLVLERCWDLPTELERARQRRKEASTALDNARARKDTRTIHSASVVLMSAQHELLRVERRS